MTSNDITELEWLAAALAGTAARLQRAAVLLRTGGDLERAEARLAALAARAAKPDSRVAPGAVAPVVDRAGAASPGVQLRSAALPIGASKVVAVFDQDSVRRPKVGLKTKVDSRPPF